MRKVVKAVNGAHLYTMGKLRKLYDWVVGWAETKYGALALFFLAVAESSFFPIPPDVLQMVLSVGRPKKSFWYALLATAGSVLGGMIGYMIGFGFYETIGVWIINALGLAGSFEAVGAFFQGNAFLAILTSALTPIPYKVFTIAAGLWKINFLVFLGASILGRGLRFFMLGLLIFIFGEKVRQFIDKYFNLLTFIALTLLILGFVAVRYLM